MSTTHLIRALLVVLGACSLWPAGFACTAPIHTPHHPPEDGALETMRSLLRPDHIASRYTYNNVPASSFASPGGSFRVWWAQSGVHAPLPQDTNNNQIPDFVELVARIADEVETKVKADSWRWPIADNTFIISKADYGGDGKIDIYLYNFDGGDGKYEVDACRKQGNATLCTGHMILQKDFSRSSYASNEEGVRVVLSHEFFHMIQAAYTSPMPGWWSEGSATWFEEHFYPAQKDFERLAQYYLQEPGRSIDDRQRGPTDAFAYGTGLFVYFLAEKLSPGAIHEIMVSHAQGKDILAAVQEAAEKRKTSLASLFEEFAVRNLFTGGRAIQGRGYPQASILAQVPIQQQTLTQFNWDLQVPSAATKYGQLNASQPLTLRLRAISGYPEAAVYIATREGFAKTGQATRLQPDQLLQVEATQEPLYVIVVNGSPDKEQAVRIEVRNAKVPQEPSNEPVDEPFGEAVADGGVADSGGTPDVASADTSAPDAAGESVNPPEKAAETPTNPSCGCATTSPSGQQPGLLFFFLCFFLVVRRSASDTRAGRKE